MVLVYHGGLTPVFSASPGENPLQHFEQNSTAGEISPGSGEPIKQSKPVSWQGACGTADALNAAMRSTARAAMDLIIERGGGSTFELNADRKGYVCNCDH